MSVVKAKSVETERITISAPRRIMNGRSYSFTLMYDGSEALTVQLPRCQLSSGLYESDGKCYCEMALPARGATSDLYAGIALRLESLLHSQERFTNATFVGHMRRTADDTAYLRLKMPQNRSQVLTEVVDADGARLNLSKFVKGCTIIPIVSVEYAYVINDTVGFNFLLKQAVLID